jgi:type I restriction enzyme S subunit
MSSDLPEGWREARLGDVARIVTGKTPSTKEPRYWGGGIPFVTPSDIKEGPWLPQVERHLSSEGMRCSAVVPAGSVLFTCIASIGKSCITREVSTLNQQINACVPSAQVDAYFLYNALQARVGDMLDLAGTTAVPIINKTTFSKVAVKLPHLDEQRRIAEVLRSVDEAIAATQCALDQAFKVARSVMVEQLVLPLTAKDRLPDGWSAATFGSIGKVQAGRQRAPSFTRGTVRPYLRVANVFDGFIDTSDVLEMPFTEREYSNYQLLEGDILLNEGQSLELVGRAARYHGEPADCCFQNTLVRFRAHGVEADYAYTLIRTMYAAGRFTEIASRTTSVAHLGVSRFAALIAPIPPLKFQMAIAELFDSMEQSIIEQRSSLVTLRAKKAALAAELLSGHVRVRA